MPHLLWQYLKNAAQRDPARPALACKGESLSYEELDRESTRVANLLTRSGIGRGSRVGLYLPKSPRAVTAILGVLKSGAAYVPIDPSAPHRRAGYILGNCEVAGLVTTGRKLAGFADCGADLRHVRTLLLADDGSSTAAWPSPVEMHDWAALAAEPSDRPRAEPGVETDPAYILYTSGSTGNPKGVILSHRNALAFVDWGADTFGVSREDRLSNHAPFHFDLSVFDLYVALRAGACVVVVPDAIAPFARELARWIDAERISVWYSVPSALTRLLLHGDMDRFRYESLRTVLFAGEVFPVKYLRALMSRLPRTAFFNLYGPTETNVCTYYEVPDLPDDQTADIPIGKACVNTEVFAVDETDRVVGAGEVGELVVKGPTVMMGYWSLPERTAQVLVRNPLQPAYHEFIYRTGDSVKLREDGQYLYVGRKDNMVKSRGYRIELGEIEQTLYLHERVKEAVVLALPDDEIGARLSAVVVLHNGHPATRVELQAFCATRLPKYMVPEEFEFRDELPRTSTGKADRVALKQELDSRKHEERRGL
jgi:amino acid adenylation domain-containing protein